MFGGVGSVGMIGSIFRPTTVRGAAALGVIRYLADLLVTLATDMAFDVGAADPVQPHVYKSQSLKDTHSSSSSRHSEL